MNEKEQKPLEHEAIIDSGFLDVGDGHSIYWVDWGNKDVKEPIFYLHGGPGGGIDQSDLEKFDPNTHRVIFHDQRGSSRSKPFCSIKNNTTQDLIGDIDKLRAHLGIDKISLFGTSWGATLALLYSIANPAAVTKMLIGAVYLARKEDEEFYIGGGVKNHFPEAWSQFKEVAPDLPDNEIRFHYKDVMFGDDAKKASEYAFNWMLYEVSTIGLTYDRKKSEQNTKRWFTESLAKLEAHYLLNNCFLEENYILNNADRLKDIEIVIIHGRQDFVCKPAAAIDLKNALVQAGGNPILHMPATGHWIRQYPLGAELLQAYTNMLWR